uniref:Uncharacterized protein n=1 Tax=Kalanchoe fedtschenkoi TaxID=63787 RepID=A0A7N0UTQ7_KALFE
MKGHHTPHKERTCIRKVNRKEWERTEDGKHAEIITYTKRRLLHVRLGDGKLQVLVTMTKFNQPNSLWSSIKNMHCQIISV